MAMKKADLEGHRDTYARLMHLARQAESEGLYGQAVDHAVAALPYVDGMMQYERKYEAAEFQSVAAVEVVLKYAPLLFRSDALVCVEELLREYKRVEKLTAADLAQRLAAARERMQRNHRLFTYIELHPESPQDELRTRLGGDQDYWRATSEQWERMGLLERVPARLSYRLAFVTRLGQVVVAKCPACGATARAPKAMLLEPATCEQCRARVAFVLLGPDTATTAMGV